MVRTSPFTSPRVIFLGILLLVAGAILFEKTPVTRADSSVAITGYAWSSNMGWVNFGPTNGYGGVSEDSSTGALSGYAWSPYFGWIDFSGAKVTGGMVTGWAQSCAAFSDKNSCSGSLDPGSGGWDGKIHLSGTAQDSSTYGIKVTDGCWSGYAWGSQSIGAIHFSDGSLFSSYKVGDPSCGGCVNGTNNYPTCDTCSDPLFYNGSSCVSCTGGCTGGKCTNGANNPPACSLFTPTAMLSASPDTIDQGQSSTLTWSSTGATSCTGTGFTASGTSGSVSTGILTTAGVLNYQVVCSGAGGNSTPGFASVTVVSPQASITASPTRVKNGSTSVVTWSSQDVVPGSCSVSGPGLSSTSGSGSQTVTITAQSTYTITCQTHTSGVSAHSSVTVNDIPVFTEF